MAELPDKARNYVQEDKGKIQETAGRVTDDRSLQAKGVGNQAAGKSKNFLEKIKDFFR
jgi:uncharacterized protein YjbJ (UPF0337 family)